MSSINSKIKLRNVFKKIISISISIFLGITVFAGCTLGDKIKNEEALNEENHKNEMEDSSKEVEADTNNGDEEEVIETIKKDKVQELIDSMCLEEKIGQMFIVGFEGYEADENIKDLIINKYIGGVILFSKNIDTVEQTTNLIKELNQLNSNNKLKLFMSVDEEGGIVSRIPKEMESFEAAWQVGSRGDLNYAFDHGKAIGKVLKTLGFNVDFAPVLDVNSNPNNPVIGTRAFSDDPNVVKNMATEVYKGLQEEGIIAVGKHFPGHGDTSVDSHVAVPVIDKSLDQLKEIELIPFEYAINEGIPMIMTSHLLLPQLDSEEVASLSPKIIKGLLREQLNFQGVTISDDMAMGGITNQYSVEEGIVKAIEAGQDMVILSVGYEEQIVAINAVVEAVKSGRISEADIDESLHRILTLKNQYLNN